VLLNFSVGKTASADETHATNIVDQRRLVWSVYLAPRVQHIRRFVECALSSLRKVVREAAPKYLATFLTIVNARRTITQ
jgi:hypothetical protein